jgi:hypothetical protein
MPDLWHDGDHAGYDDTIMAAVAVAEARQRYAAQEAGNPYGTCGACGRTLIQRERDRRGGCGPFACDRCEEEALAACDAMERARDASLSA